MSERVCSDNSTLQWEVGLVSRQGRTGSTLSDERFLMLLHKSRTGKVGQGLALYASVTRVSLARCRTRSSHCIPHELKYHATFLTWLYAFIVCSLPALSENISNRHQYPPRRTLFSLWLIFMKRPELPGPTVASNSMPG